MSTVQCYEKENFISCVFVYLYNYHSKLAAGNNINVPIDHYMIDINEILINTISNHEIFKNQILSFSWRTHTKLL